MTAHDQFESDRKLPSYQVVGQEDDSVTTVQVNELVPNDSLTSQKPKLHSSIDWPLSNTFIALSVLAPVLALSVWLGISTSKNRPLFNSFAGAGIGGRFNQSQAKAIDVLCGAFLAPLFMGLVDYIWFRSAHVFVVNEQRNTRGVPLASLATASTTWTGSYNILSLWSLLRGRTWRLTLLALMVLVSAVARSSLSNVIAYQAFNEDVASGPVNILRTLNDGIISTMGNRAYLSGLMSAYNYTISQQYSASNQVTALLTQLNYEGPLALNDSAYIGGNTTMKALNELPDSVTHLYNVPGYRKTVTCIPDRPAIFSTTSSGATAAKINLIWWTAPGNITGPLAGYWPGTVADLNSTYNDDYALAAFSMNNTEVYLAFLSSFNNTGDTLPSSYGDIEPFAMNMTAFGFNGMKSVMSIAGIRCWIDRQDGLLNYTRSSSLQWSITEANFASAKTKVPSYLSQWQTILNYRAPGDTSSISGLGPPLSKAGVNISDGTKNFTSYALSYLYASAEAERIMYEVAASDEKRDLPGYFFNVTGSSTVQYYRITYVPVILLTGLITLFGAAVIVAAMAVYSFRTFSAQSFRQVDVLRLIIDSVVGLHEHPELADRIVDSPNDTISKWAKGYRVAYSRVEENGETVLRLIPVKEGDDREVR